MILEFLGLKNFLQVAPDERPVSKQLRRVGVGDPLDLLVKPCDACAGEWWRFPLIIFARASCGKPQIDSEELHGVIKGNLLVFREPKVCGIGGPCDCEGMSLTIPQDEVANEGCVHQLLGWGSVRDPLPLLHNLQLLLCGEI